MRKRWALLLSPFVVVGGLIAIAPAPPPPPQTADPRLDNAFRRDGEPFHYIPDD